MKRAVLVIVAAFMAVAMLATPVFAESPNTLTLTGTLVIAGQGDNYAIVAGKSDNILPKLRNGPDLWTGDISGSGIADGNWLIRGGSLALAVGTYYLEDVTVAGVGTGDLTLGYSGLDLWVKSGSDDLRSIRGKGTVTPVTFIKYTYELVIQINP